LESKIKFINYVISEKIIVFNRQRVDINKQIELVDPGLTKIDNSWDYLLDLKMWSLTQEKIKEIEDRMKKMNKELDLLRKTSVSEMWTSELELLI